MYVRVVIFSLERRVYGEEKGGSSTQISKKERDIPVTENHERKRNAQQYDLRVLLYGLEKPFKRGEQRR